MLLVLLKTIHIVGATLFFGAGLATAFFKVRADQSGKIEDIVFAQKNIVLADWLFTVPSGIILPVTGIWLASLYGLPLSSGWILWGIGLYTIAGLCWLPAAFLQIKMRDLAIKAMNSQETLEEDYKRFQLIWLLLGVPAFFASLLALYIMVAKQVPFVSH